MGVCPCRPRQPGFFPNCARAGDAGTQRRLDGVVPASAPTTTRHDHRALASDRPELAFRTGVRAAPSQQRIWSARATTIRTIKHIQHIITCGCLPIAPVAERSQERTRSVHRRRRRNNPQHNFAALTYDCILSPRKRCAKFTTLLELFPLQNSTALSRMKHAGQRAFECLLYLISILAIDAPIERSTH